MPWDQSGGMMALMVILWILLILAIVAGTILLVRTLWPRGDSARPRERRDALGILEDRYARGEIDDEEFERRRGALRQEGS